ncbi:aminopeptidase, partial [Candidatus Marinamargulisbacteria bacterium SCGC AG-414-C22]
MLEKYAKLLCHYSINAQKNQTVLIKTSTLAVPLVKALYKELLHIGCYVETDLDFEDKDRIFYDNAQPHQLKKPSSFYSKAIHEFDALIRIIAPHNLKSTASVDSNLKKTHQEALAPLKKTYMKRSAKKELKWVLCIYPTQAAAQEAG